MKRTVISSFALLAPLTWSQSAQADPVFDNSAFQDSAAERFEGVEVGYSFAVVHDGVIVGSASGGYAVQGVDSPAPIPMTASTPNNVGSTVKLISSIALMAIFESDGSATVEEWLDREIIDYMPALWRQKVLDACIPGQICLNRKLDAVQYVTFRDLLQHKSGLAKDDSIILDGVDPYRTGVAREYSNDNIGILTRLIPYIVDPEFGEDLDDLAEDEGITSVSDDFWNDHLATYFGQYMQDEVFDLVETSVADDIELPPGMWHERLVPSCDHKTTYANTPYFRDKDFGIDGDVPLRGDVDGDGIDDLIVWRPSNGRWYVRSVDGTLLVNGLQYGIAALGDKPLLGDIDADGADDFVIWRDSTASWYAKSADGVALTTNFQYGETGDIPLVGNIGGAVGDEFVVWRPSTGRWYGSQEGFISTISGVSWGVSGDVPHLGDVDGDGGKDLVIFRPSNARWFAKDPITGTVLASNLQWGGDGDVSLVGDVSGEGAADFVIYRPSSGKWFARTASNALLFRNVEWGAGEVTGPGSTIPLLADVNGDFSDNLALYRTGNGYWSAAGRRYAFGYDTYFDFNGDPAITIEEPPGCYAQGGYWFASLEYAAVLAAFETDTFVSEEVRELMVDERLGWAGRTTNVSTKYPFIYEEYGVTSIVSHGGANRSFLAATVALPDGYYLFGSLNSDVLDGEHLEENLIEAWIDAMETYPEFG